MKHKELRVSAETASTEETRSKKFENPPELVCYRKEIILMSERKWVSNPVNTSFNKDSLSAFILKMFMRKVRNRDQDESNDDGAVDWDTMIPNLLRAFGDRRARYFSHKDWLRKHSYGSNKTRFEYCENLKGILMYVRAIQGHTGGMTILLGLMGMSSFFTIGKNSTIRVVRMTTCLFSRLDSWLEGREVKKEDKKSSSYPSTFSEIIKMTQNPAKIFQYQEKSSITAIGKEIKMLYID